jgi:DNA-binding PadR family transcriptional regulator
MAIPTLTWKIVLKEIASRPQPVRGVEIAEFFDKATGEMYTRLSRLRQWGYLRFADNRRGVSGRAGRAYEITERGRQKVEELNGK